MMKKRLASALLLALCLLATLPALAGEGDQEFTNGNPPAAPWLHLRGNPTTGYQWLYEVEDPAVLEICEEDYIADQSAGGMTGVGGDFSFRLDGVTSGVTTVTFRYARTWEEEAPLCTLTYTVYVDDDLNVFLMDSTVDAGY